MPTANALGWRDGDDFRISIAGAQEKAALLVQDGQAQAQAAAGMNIVAPQIDSKLVLALGDNFYFDGVKNATDFRFKTTFDDVYSGDNLKSLPWHVIAGNHDHHGNVDAQITYSKFNRRWNFPASYHSSKWRSADNSVTVDIMKASDMEAAIDWLAASSKVRAACCRPQPLAWA